MARRKTLPESVRAKYALAERLGALRAELYGERGGPEMARRLGIPVRTWYNYEAGVTVPAEVVLRIIELTGVEPCWLLHGTGSKFRALAPASAEPNPGPVPSVASLLRAAIQILEQEEARRGASPLRMAREFDGETFPTSSDAEGGIVLVGVEPGARDFEEDEGPRFIAAQEDWLDDEEDFRCVRVEGEAMAPILANGACAAYVDREESAAELNGKLVVAWYEGQPIVRWFQDCGRFAVLRAENPATMPNQVLVDLRADAEETRIRRVLWINTPH